MELIKLYSDSILKPLEQEVKSLQIKVHKNKFLHTNEKEKEYLKKFDNLLFDYYEHLGALIDKEIKSNSKN